MMKICKALYKHFKTSLEALGLLRDIVMCLRGSEGLWLLKTLLNHTANALFHEASQAPLNLFEVF